MESIASRRNPLAAHVKKLGTDRSYREGCGEFLCDGWKLLEEALKSGAAVTAVLAASGAPFPLAEGTRVVHAPQEVINSLSPLKNPQDILFISKIPPKSGYAGIAGTQILLDGVQDPGNVGSVIRTSDALGIGGILLTGGCADPYNPKAVRASMGAVFRQKIVNIGLSGLMELKGEGVRFIGAATGEGSRDISEIKLKDAVIAIGSEGRGLSEGVSALCGEKARIPMSAGCESLNAAAAAAIFMWEAVRGEG